MWIKLFTTVLNLFLASDCVPVTLRRFWCPAGLQTQSWRMWQRSDPGKEFQLLFTGMCFLFETSQCRWHQHLYFYTKFHFALDIRAQVPWSVAVASPRWAGGAGEMQMMKTWCSPSLRPVAWIMQLLNIWAMAPVSTAAQVSVRGAFLSPVLSV